MRRIIVFPVALAIALAAGSSEPGLAQTTVLRIEPALKMTSPNEPSFSVEVWVDDVVTTDPCPLVGGGPCGLGGYQVDIVFDPTVISFQSFEDGPFLTSTGRTPFMCPLQTVRHDPSNGILSYSCATSGDTPLGPEGSGHLATVTFAPVNIGDSNLHLQNTKLAEASPYGTAIPHTTQDGSVTVDYTADLSVAKTAPATVTAPGNIDYNVQVTNLGLDEAESVTLVDTLSSHVGFVSASSGCAYDSEQREVTCDLGDIGATSSESVNITVSVAASKAGRTIANVADATSVTQDDDTENNDDEASTTVDLANVNIVKSAPEQVEKGATGQYEIVVTSTGPSDAANVVVSDDLPPEVVYVGYSATAGSCAYYAYGHFVSCQLGNMATSSSATITITVTFPDSDSYLCNSAKAQWTQQPSGVNESEPAPTEVGEVDRDGDGCFNWVEPEIGRDPDNPYDFYDVPSPPIDTAYPSPPGPGSTKDRVVSGFDLSALLWYGGCSNGGGPNTHGADYNDDKNGNGIDDGAEYDKAGLAGPGTGSDGAITGFDLSDLLSQGGDDCSGGLPC